jgi:RNA polymerase sigma factor (TIGR02999 family)
VGADGGDGDVPRWNGRGHFFAAAAEAMRRILVDAARRRQRIKHGGGLGRESLDATEIAAPADAPEDLLGLDAALDRLDAADPVAARLVKLRYFAGFTVPQAAEALGVSPRKANFLWSFARAWLRREMSGA